MDVKPLETFYNLAVLEPRDEDIQNLKSCRTDWEEVADIACRFHSTSILYKNIKRYGLGDRFKPATLSTLKDIYLDTMAKNMHFMNEFFRLAALFNNKGIRLAPLKGISMLIDTYPDDGLRPIVDLDLLIDTNDFGKAVGLLGKNGYNLNARPKTRGLMDTNHGQDYLVLSPANSLIELHYRLFAWYEERYVYKIDSRKFFNDSFVKTVKGINLNFLRKEDEFYYSLMNIFNNRASFRYYLDCDSIVRMYGGSFDWDRAARHIRSSGIKHHIVAALNFIRQRLKTPIPDNLLEEAPAKKGVFRIEKNLYESGMNRYGQQINSLFGAPNMMDKINLALIYTKWLCFKAFGFFRRFFMLHDNPISGNA